MKTVVIITILSSFVCGYVHAQVDEVIATNRDAKAEVSVTMTAPSNVQFLHVNEKIKEIKATGSDEGDSSPSSPPLETDDPDTPGKGGYEVKTDISCDKTKGDRACENGWEFNLGVGDKAQVSVSKSFVQDKATGQPTFHGVGTTSVGVKYRFYDKNGIQIAIFPSYQIDDGTRQKNPDGTLVDSDGRSLFVPVIARKTLGKDNQWAVVVEGGYTVNFDHKDQNALFTSVAVGHTVGKDGTLMGEIVRNGKEVDMNIGYVQVILPDDNSCYEKSVFTSGGTSLRSDDGKNHVRVMLGLSIARKPNCHG